MSVAEPEVVGRDHGARGAAVDAYALAVGAEPDETVPFTVTALDAPVTCTPADVAVGLDESRRSVEFSMVMSEEPETRTVSLVESP